MNKNKYKMQECDIEELSRLLNRANDFSFRGTLKRFIYLDFSRKDVAFWPNAQIIYACSFDDRCNGLIKKQVSLWERRNFAISAYDDILMAYVLLTKTKILSDAQEKKLIENIKLALSCYFGEMIPYRKNDTNKIYIDLLGMVPQFLISYGVREKNREIVMWGVRQFTDFVKNATDEETGLPYHAYSLLNGEKLGVIGWGRAMGWMLVGLSESIASLTDEYVKERNELIGIYDAYVGKIEKYQRRDGGFSWQLQAKDGPFDSSATAMILQSMCLMSGILDSHKKYDRMMKRMMARLEKCYNNGLVNECSAECGGVGIYPQVYGSHAWSVAPYLICKSLNYNMNRNKNVEE